jgi:SAM-dependent methyltransferase
MKEYKQFSKLTQKREYRLKIQWKDRYPCLNDRTETTPFDAHYIYHPAWAARILARQSPKYHVDISSTLNFCTIVSAFIPVKFYDYRPANLHLSNLESKSVNLIDLPFEDKSIDSLSCMHTVEHIGLGRYGDALDPDGDLKAINELIRVLAFGGDLLFVVPIGKPRIMFNAHRIYSYDQICNLFKELELKEFILIPDNAGESGIIMNASKEKVNNQIYGCGCFWFKRGSA